jgi:hypothetical protein
MTRGGAQSEPDRNPTEVDDRERAMVERYHRLSSEPEWRKSEERRRAVAFAGFGSTGIALVGAIIGAAVRYSLLLAEFYESYPDWMDYQWSWIDTSSIIGSAVLGFSIAGLVAWLASYMYWHSCRRAFAQRARFEAEFGDLREAEERVDARHFASLWSINSQRLDLYHKIATEHAEKSFRAAQAATWLGFSLVAFCVLVAIFAQSAASAVAASVLGVVAGGLAAYVNSTFMRSQETAAQQLRAYFAQPLEFSRHLTAERVASDLPAGAPRERALEAIAVQIVSPSAGTGAPPTIT